VHLRTLRREAAVSRAELARRAGVPVSTLRNWENGRGFPGVPALLRLAEALGVPAERLTQRKTVSQHALKASPASSKLFA
jgi:transcriptional regulator with XRE-family HTH domain